MCSKKFESIFICVSNLWVNHFHLNLAKIGYIYLFKKKNFFFDLGECLELPNKRVFYTVISCSVFLTQRKRTKYDQQNQSRDYSYMERNYKMMVWTQMYGLLNVVLIRDKLCIHLFLNYPGLTDVKWYLEEFFEFYFSFMLYMCTCVYMCMCVFHIYEFGVFFICFKVYFFFSIKSFWKVDEVEM